MKDVIQAFPLSWPAGWRRCPVLERYSASFRNYGARLSVQIAVDRVLNELELMNVDESDVVISTNLTLRQDGRPRTDRDYDPTDCGAAVYWRDPSSATNKTPCIAIDQYDRVADNLGAIAATLDALRTINRHGGAAILERAFLGLTALPAPEQWFQVLGVSAHASETEIRAAHSRLVREHPSFRTGGDAADLARINVARDEGLQRRSVR